jgi:hypothetical protein
MYISSLLLIFESFETYHVCDVTIGCIAHWWFPTWIHIDLVRSGNTIGYCCTQNIFQEDNTTNHLSLKSTLVYIYIYILDRNSLLST